MTDPKKPIPEHAQSKALTDDQLVEVVGGTKSTFTVIATGFKCCVADPSHVYADVLDACPICGCKEYTSAE